MARSLRLEIAGGLYHITARGNAKQLIYLDELDRTRFCELLTQVVDRFGWLCQAYCLMGNHHHLLVETPRPNLARGMRQLNGVYAQGFNRRHEQVGHLFQARYSARLVDKHDYLLEVARYIVLNPVRARLCNHPAAWPWSSYRASAGIEPPPPFLNLSWLHDHFGHGPPAHVAYRDFIDQGIDSVPPTTIADLYTGDNDFAAQSAPFTPLEEIPRRQTHPVRPPLEELFAREPDSAPRIAYREHDYTLREIADHLGVHYTTISRKLRTIEEHQRKT